MVTKPRYPQYVLINNTGRDIGYSQWKCDGLGVRQIAQGEKKIFTWFDQTMKEKKLVIHADGDNQFYPIDKIKRLKGFTTSKDTYYVQVKTKGDFRTVEIRSHS
mmetsp:Transcript_47285/g.34575  ORF Transcript_47285/g.34575 Transcript_47285/m.34575 type:complete len:104 (+) Transcript_47285:914-1225(+)